jgi:hypothetical protein
MWGNRGEEGGHLAAAILARALTHPSFRMWKCPGVTQNVHT